MMLVNVICVVLNQQDPVAATIESFIQQQVGNKRLIIIDGGSTDGTVDVLRKYSAYIDFWSSEPDKGISDAFNKGLAQTQPGYVYFLGAGDTFCSFDALAKLISNHDYKSDLLVCGKIKRVDAETGKVLGCHPKEQTFNKKTLLFRMSLPHQGLATSTVFFDKFGLFRTDCRFAMDYDLLLRAYVEFPPVVLKDVIVASWMSGGIGADRTLDVLREYHRIKIENRVAPKATLFLLHFWILFKFFIKKCLHG